MLKGIPNLGNTCYSSVMIQLLFVSKSLITLIYQCKTKNKIIINLKNLIYNYFMDNGKIVDEKILNHFYNSLQCPKTQQDSAEFLEKILNIISTLNNDIGKLIKIEIYDKDIYRINDRFITKYILDIPIPVSYYLDEEFNFNKNIWNNYFKNIKILNYPQYFYIHISRNNESGIKLSNNIKNIWFNKKLVVNKYVKDNNNSNGLTLLGKTIIRYKLIGFGVHIGDSIKSGHWISYIMNNQKWFYCSDSIIYEVNKDTCKKELKQASLLLYKKIEQYNKYNLAKTKNNTKEKHIDDISIKNFNRKHVVKMSIKSKRK